MICVRSVNIFRNECHWNGKQVPYPDLYTPMVFGLWSPSLWHHVDLYAVYQNFRGSYCFHLQGRNEEETSIPKMEVICSSKMLLATYKIMWHHNPEDQNPNFYHYENLKSHTGLHIATDVCVRKFHIYMREIDRINTFNPKFKYACLFLTLLHSGKICEYSLG